MNQLSEPCSFYLEQWLKTKRTWFLIAAIAAGILVVVIYRIFSSFLVFLPWDISTISVAVAMGLCLSLELIGIPFFLIQMKETFLNPMSSQNQLAEEFYHLFWNRLCDRILFVATLLFVLLPFVALDIQRILSLGTTPFYALEPNIIAMVLDIFNIVTAYLLLYLFAIILWMLLVVGWTLNDAQRDRGKVPVDILAPDGVGGLGSVQALVRSLITYYFIIVALLIVSYLSPEKQIWSYQSLFVILLFIAGILFFFIGLSSIRNLARGRVAEEIGALNERIHTRYNRLKEIVSDDDETNTEMLKKEQVVLDACYTERSRLMNLYDKNQAFDARTIAQSVASVIIPVLAFIVKLSSGADAFLEILSLVPL
jgi:hypothetical protein